MSNTYFRFKQFTIQQDACGMKVSTDACIQGAWTPVQESMKRVLDIGAGTGLLSMMIAQRLPHALIDAVEWDEAAAAQAKQNVADSPFAARVAIVHGDAVRYAAPHRYDLIICNPPFFKDALRGPDESRNSARHAGSLNAESLAGIIRQNLADKGIASIMLPPAEQEAFAEIAAAAGIYTATCLQVADKASARISRVICLYGFMRNEQLADTMYAPQQLVIKKDNGRYTNSFIRLLSPFYLHL